MSSGDFGDDRRPESQSERSRDGIGTGRDPLSDLSRVNADLKALSDDFVHLLEDSSESAGRVTEDLLGADIVASTEVVNDIGLLFEFWSELSAIQREQVSHMLADYQQTARDLGERQPPAEVFTSHMFRRAGRLLGGVNQCAGLAVAGLRRAQTLHDGLWSPYVSVVFRDATGRGS